MAETDALASGVVAANADNPDAAKNGNPSGSSDWTKGLDEGIQKKLERFKGDPQLLAKSYVELETYASKSFQDMSDSEKEKYLKRLGLPEKPEEYELSAIEIPKEIPRSAEADADFKAFVHSAKLTKDQAKKLHEWSMTRFLASYKAQQAAAKKLAEDREAALRLAWGTSMEANNSAVDQVIALGGEEFAKYMASGPGKEAVVRQGLYAISRQFATEGALIGGRPQVGQAKSETRPGFVFDTSKSPELAQTR